jgi:hypothetical protein
LAIDYSGPVPRRPGAGAAEQYDCGTELHGVFCRREDPLSANPVDRPGWKRDGRGLDSGLMAPVTAVT